MLTGLVDYFFLLFYIIFSSCRCQIQWTETGQKAAISRRLSVGGTWRIQPVLSHRALEEDTQRALEVHSEPLDDTGICRGIKTEQGLLFIWSEIKASKMLVAPRISECFGLLQSALVCYSLPWSAMVCYRCKPLDFVLRALRALRPVCLLEMQAT